MNNKIIKIAITGPESTGKSSLAKSLAKHFSSYWVPEYAREYTQSLNREYTSEDIVKICKEQNYREEEFEKYTEQILIADSNPLVCKIWHEVKYGKSNYEIERIYESQKYDLVLLCNIDLPWKDDPLREHPKMRQHLFDLYYKQLENSQIEYSIISGSGLSRVQNAISIIKKITDYEKH